MGEHEWYYLLTARRCFYSSALLLTMSTAILRIILLQLPFCDFQAASKSKQIATSLRPLRLYSLLRTLLHTVKSIRLHLSIFDSPLVPEKLARRPTTRGKHFAP